MQCNRLPVVEWLLYLLTDPANPTSCKWRPWLTGDGMQFVQLDGANKSAGADLAIARRTAINANTISIRATLLPKRA